MTENSSIPAQSTETTKNRNILIFIAKLALGIFLLVVLILWKGNGQKVLTIFSNFKWSYLIGLFIIAFTMTYVSCLKWNLFLRAHDINVSVLRLVRLYIIGYFFNNFFPSMVGGDVTRIYLLGNQINSKSKSAASVFLERFTGFTALSFLALFFSLLNLKILVNPLIGISIGLIVFVCFAMLVFLFSPHLRDAFSTKLDSFYLFHGLFSKIKQLYEDITFFSKRPKTFIFAMNYSFFFHFLSCVNVYWCCLTLGFHPPFLTVAVVTPIILLLNNIPVSFNNIGWWEWSFSVLLMSAGGGAELGLAVALTLRGISLTLSLVGGMFFLFEHLPKNIKAASNTS